MEERTADRVENPAKIFLKDIAAIKISKTRQTVNLVPQRCV